MKELETLTREETRDIVEQKFSSTTSDITHTVPQSEPETENPFPYIIGREAYRLSPLSEW